MKVKILKLLALLIIVAFPLLVHAVAEPAAENPGDPCPGQPANEICNPLGIGSSLETFAIKLGTGIYKLAIPLAVIIFIWIGIQFFLAQGNAEKIKKAKTALLWTIIGLAVILIGTGFISLVKSILDLSKS